MFMGVGRMLQKLFTARPRCKRCVVNNFQFGFRKKLHSEAIYVAESTKKRARVLFLFSSTSTSTSTSGRHVSDICRTHDRHLPGRQHGRLIDEGEFVGLEEGVGVFLPGAEGLADAERIFATTTPPPLHLRFDLLAQRGLRGALIV